MKLPNLEGLRQRVGRKTVSLLIGIGIVLLVLSPELALFSFMLDAAFLDVFIFLVGFQIRMYLSMIWMSVVMFFKNCMRVARQVLSSGSAGGVETINEGDGSKN